MSSPMSPDQERQAVELLRDAKKRISKEVAKVIVGQEQVIKEMLTGLLAGGHCLITAEPVASFRGVEGLKRGRRGRRAYA